MKILKLLIIFTLILFYYSGVAQPYLAGGYQGGEHGDGGVETIATGTDKLIQVEEMFNVYPNPFKEEIRITMALKTSSNVKLNIYDAVNREVKFLFQDNKCEIGIYYFTWDGKNNSGVKVVSGTYYLRAIIDKEQIVKKIVLLE